jgi:hypothetical protein
MCTRDMVGEEPAGVLASRIAAKSQIGEEAWAMLAPPQSNTRALSGRAQAILTFRA